MDINLLRKNTKLDPNALIYIIFNIYIIVSNSYNK